MERKQFLMLSLDAVPVYRKKKDLKVDYLTVWIEDMHLA